MDIIQVTDNRINRAIRFIKNKCSFDAHDSVQIAPYGDDSCPISNVKGIKSKTSTASIHAILGYFNRNPKSLTGEKRLFATDSEGNFVCSIWFKNDGSIEFNNTSNEGTPTNYMVKFNELKTEFNKLQADFGTLITLFNKHTHTVATTGAVVSGSVDATGTAASTLSQASSNIANIDNCKNSKLKTT
jgi:hypothetical protein